LEVSGFVLEVPVIHTRRRAALVFLLVTPLLGLGLAACVGK
jgi:hypothetical protein